MAKPTLIGDPRYEVLLKRLDGLPVPAVVLDLFGVELSDDQARVVDGALRGNRNLSIAAEPGAGVTTALACAAFLHCLTRPIGCTPGGTLRIGSIALVHSADWGGFVGVLQTLASGLAKSDHAWLMKHISVEPGGLYFDKAGNPSWSVRRINVARLAAIGVAHPSVMAIIEGSDLLPVWSLDLVKACTSNANSRIVLAGAEHREDACGPWGWDHLRMAGCEVAR